jgi:hypothetical protein
VDEGSLRSNGRHAILILFVFAATYGGGRLPGLLTCLLTIAASSGPVRLLLSS